MSGVFAHPAGGPVARHVELYIAAARQRGADPMVAQRLPALLAVAGLQDVRWEIVQLMHREGPHKDLTRVTMQRIAQQCSSTASLPPTSSTISTSN